MATKLTTGEWVKDTLERALSTYVQTLIAFVTAASTMDISVLKAAALAAIPAGLNVLYQAVAGWQIPTALSWWADTGLRCLRTALYTALGLMIANAFDWTSVDAWQAVGTSVAVAVLVVIKSALAERRKGTVTPASFVRI